MSVRVKVRGLREVDQMLRDLGGPEASRAIRLSMMKAAQPIEGEAKSRAPSRSGALRAAIGRWFIAEGRGEILGFALPSMGGKFRVKVGPRMKDRAAIALHNLAYKRKRKGIFYAHFLEFGTKRTPKQEFLAPSLQATSNEAVEIFDRDIRARLKRIAKRKK